MSKQDQEKNLENSTDQLGSQSGHLSESQLDSVAGGIVITGGKSTLDDGERGILIIGGMPGTITPTGGR